VLLENSVMFAAVFYNSLKDGGKKIDKIINLFSNSRGQNNLFFPILII